MSCSALFLFFAIFDQLLQSYKIQKLPKDVLDIHKTERERERNRVRREREREREGER